MPTYAYRCTECSTAFDIQQAFEDAALTECPNCAGRLRKVYGSIGVTFSGSGFYRTDSRSGSGTSSGSGSSSSGEGSSGSSAASSSSSSGAASGNSSSSPSPSSASVA